jgi:hypothetical protein
MEIPEDQGYSIKAKVIVVVFALLVGAIHFLIGPNYQGVFKPFMSGYLIDIILPASLFLLLHLALQKQLPRKVSRFASLIMVLFIGFSVEILQFFDIHLFGETYDPLDFLMYILGVILGFLIDKAIWKI